MIRIAALVLLLLVAACAPSYAPAPPDGHPASPDAAPAPFTFVASPLPPTPAADLPASLRPDAPPSGREGMRHEGMRHEGMQHESDPSAPAPSLDAPLRAALDAYLVIHESLAADHVDGVAEAARALDAAVARLVEQAPAAEPHFWHRRTDEVETVRAALRQLATPADVEAARLAFGRVSAPLASWVEALGVPEGYDLQVFTCGMVETAPEGGVWLQDGGATRNPYFGEAMPRCGRAEAPTAEPHHGSH